MCIMNVISFKTTVRVLTMLTVAIASSGCAMKGDIRLLQDELRTMAARQDSLVRELRMQSQQTQDTLRTQGDQMFDLRGDINRQLQQISQSLTRLEAIAGENQRGLAAVRDQLANMRRTSATPGGSTMPESSGSTAGETLAGAGGGNADQLYDVARGQLDRGSLNSATQAFQEFVSTYPNDARAPDAHFALADILAQQDRPRDALQAFQSIAQLFPTAARVPDALFRVAQLQEELGDVEQAKATLQRIMNTYPDAPSAMLARNRLREIG